MGRISTILAESNPWWRNPGAGLEGVLPDRREPAFGRVRERLFRGDRRRGVLLIGMRWVGKTELAKQVAHAVRTEDGLPGTQLAYVSVDATKLRGSLAIDGVLTAWDPYRRPDQPSLLVLDEAHRLLDPTPQQSWNWARQLKGVIDDGKIEVVATGSDAGRLLEGTGEGAGRWQYVEMEPLSFREFRRFRYLGSEPPLQATLHEDLAAYLRIGGFPGMATLRQDRRALEGIQHYARDILLDELGGVRQISKLHSAFSILMDISGLQLNKSSLSESVGGKSDTIESWLSALESVRLIQRVPQVPAIDRNKLHQHRAQPKAYGTDPGLVAAFSRWSDAALHAEGLARLYEAAVLRHLREIARDCAEGTPIFCLRPQPKRRGEIDFALVNDAEEELFLVEVAAGSAGIEDKARRLRDVGGDPAICGQRRVYATLVAPSDRSTGVGVPAVGAARFLESISVVDGRHALQPLRELSAVVGG